ncbi:MAG: YraN family protein, partial [Epsilonproteobacteria bacterium]|nr:YraN family protein [Campylobacterota bacterium]
MSRAKGDVAEERACAYLLENDYAIVERNFYSRFGEIDIIAK